MIISRFILWAFNFFARLHFGQHGEDVIVHKLFNKDIKNGFYLDIGAHHPFRQSNTAYLWLKGWNGVNIDANPASIRIFNRIRKRDKNILMAVVDTKTASEKNTIILKYNPDVDFDLGASCDTVTAAARASALTASIEVPCDSMENIINQYAPSSQDDFHFMNIDIEGFDERSIQTMKNWRVKPQVICIEITDANTLGDLLKSRIHITLENNGYDLKGKTGISSIYQKIKN